MISTTESESCLLVTLLLDTPGLGSLLSRDTLDQVAAPPPPPPVSCRASSSSEGGHGDTCLDGAWSGVSGPTLASVLDNLLVIFGRKYNSQYFSISTFNN